MSDQRQYETIENSLRYCGFNPGFRRMVYRKRREARRVATASAAPPIDVARVPTFTEMERERNRELARKAREIHEVTKALRSMPPPTAPAAEIIAGAAERYGLKVADIIGKSRDVLVSAVRHHAMGLVHVAYPDWGLPRLGRTFQRDHTTVLAALRRNGIYRPRSIRAH